MKKWSFITAGVLSAVLVFNAAVVSFGDVVTIEDVPVPLASGAVLAPSSPGTVEYKNNKAVIDASNTAEGYVTVKYLGALDKKIKAQVTKAGGTTYTYDITNSAYQVFPLTEGNGKYTVTVFENISGTKYATANAAGFDVTLKNEYLPFLYPNQYVNFSSGSAVVKKAEELAKDSADELDTIKKIYNFTTENIVYDYEKAKTVTSGYLPNVDTVLSTKKGICFDYAALMTSMLRSQSIPTKLVVGYSGKAYHAWISAYVKEVGWIDNIIYFDGTTWKLMDPTFAAGAKAANNKAIADYIGDGKNYTAKFAY